MNETIDRKFSAPLTVTTLKDLSWKENTEKGYGRLELKAGTKVEICFSEANPSRVYVTVPGAEEDRFTVIRTAAAYLYLTGFKKMPSMKTLRKYVFDSVVKTPTGYKTEPDGFGPDGSPSWLLVVGLI